MGNNKGLFKEKISFPEYLAAYIEQLLSCNTMLESGVHFNFTNRAKTEALIVYPTDQDRKVSRQVLSVFFDNDESPPVKMFVRYCENEQLARQLGRD